MSKLFSKSYKILSKFTIMGCSIDIIRNLFVRWIQKLVLRAILILKIFGSKFSQSYL